MDFESPELIPDADLQRALLILEEERRSRLLEAADPSTLIAWGFANLFKSDGTPTDPVMRSGVLVCPGARWGKSPLSHRCSFAKVVDDWVWESKEKFADEMRYKPGPSQMLQTVTLLIVPPDTAVDVLFCQAKNAVHVLKTVRSFLTSQDELTLVSARTVRPADHR